MLKKFNGIILYTSVLSLSRIEYIYSDTATNMVVVDHSGHITLSLVFVHGTQSRILSSLSVQSMRTIRKRSLKKSFFDGTDSHFCDVYIKTVPLDQYSGLCEHFPQ